MHKGRRGNSAAFVFGVGDEAGIVTPAGGISVSPLEVMRSAGFVAMKTITEMDCAM
jgi:hypothetical protein